MSQVQQIMGALDRSELFKKVQQLTQNLTVELDLAEDDVVDLEARQEYQNQELKKFKEELGTKEIELADLERNLAETHSDRDLLEKQVAFLQDLSGFLEGKLFRSSCFGAGFFTLTLSEFAYLKGEGEMSLEKAIGKSADDFCVGLKEKKYLYLKAWDGKVYFHSGEVDFERFVELIKAKGPVLDQERTVI